MASKSLLKNSKGGTMKIWNVVIKGLLIIGVLVGLSNFLAWTVNEMNHFKMEYTFGFILVNLALVVAYLLIGVLITFGYPFMIPHQKWIGIGVLAVLIGLAVIISLNVYLFVKYRTTIQEIWRVGGLVLGLVVGNALSKRILKS
jgi:hypothetical protein